MTPDTLNERLALALFGWRRCEDNPEFWVPPGEQPDQHYYHTETPADYLCGDGMLAVLEEMRGKSDYVWWKFVRALINRNWPMSAEVNQQTVEVLFRHLAPQMVAECALAALEGERDE